MRKSRLLKFLLIAGLVLCACAALTGAARADAVTHPAAPAGSTLPGPWTGLGLIILFGSMSSFGWSRFVPESIGHDTERVNQGDSPEPRQALGKYVPDDIFRFCVAMSSVELPSVVSPGPHVLFLAKGSDLLGVRSAWAGIFDTHGSGIRRVAVQDGAEPAPDPETRCVPLDQVPELADWIRSGEPTVVLAESRRSPLSQELFGAPQSGIGLLLPLRAGTEVVGFHYWLGIQNAAMVENPRVIALASASSVLAGRISSLRRKDKLTGASQELEISRAMGQFAGAETWNKNLPATLLRVIGELCRLELATLWLADSRGKQLRSVADLPAAKVHAHERSRVLQVGEDGICGAAAASGEPVWVPDVTQDQRYIMHLEEVKAEYAVPLIRNGRLLGLLAVQTSEPDGLSSIERQRIREVASHAAEILEYHNLFYGSQCELRKLTALSEIGRTALTVPDAGALFDETVKIIAENFGYPHVYVFLQQGDKDFLILRSKACHDEPALPLHFRAPLARGMVGFTGRTATTLLANDVKKESLYFPKLASIGSELCVPILDGERLLGVIDLMDRRKGAFLLDDMAMLEAVAELLALSVKRFQSTASMEFERARGAAMERMLTTFTSATSPADLLHGLFKELQQVGDAESAYLLSRSRGSKSFRVIAGETDAGQTPAFITGSELEPGDSRLNEVLRSRQPIVVSSLETDVGGEAHEVADARYMARGLRSVALLPITLDGADEVVLLVASAKPGGLREDVVTTMKPWIAHVSRLLRQLGGGTGTFAAASQKMTAGVMAPENLSETLGDILGRVQTLLMRISGDTPGGEDFRATLHEMEQSAAKAYEVLQQLPAPNTPRNAVEHAAPAAPVIPGPASPAPAAKTAVPKPGQSTKGARSILVIDDQENILDVVVDILTSEDHRVDTAATMAEAIAKIKGARYDLVFSDWSLDSGDAKPVIEAAAQAGLPVVVTTGWRGEVDENSVHELGAKAVLRKPFDVKKLLEAVHIYGLNPAEVSDHD